MKSFGQRADKHKMVSNIRTLTSFGAVSRADVKLTNRHGSTVTVDHHEITSVRLNGRELLHREATEAAASRARILSAAANWQPQEAPGETCPVPDLDHLLLNGNRLEVSLVEDQSGFQVRTAYFNQPRLGDDPRSPVVPSSTLFLPSPQIPQNRDGRSAVILLPEQKAKIFIEFDPEVSAVARDCRFAPDCVKFTISGQPQVVRSGQSSETMTYRFWLENIA